MKGEKKVRCKNPISSGVILYDLNDEGGIFFLF